MVATEYGGDYAIVQTAKWGVLYILSRVREPPREHVNVSVLPSPVNIVNNTVVLDRSCSLHGIKCDCNLHL